MSTATDEHPERRWQPDDSGGLGGIVTRLPRQGPRRRRRLAAGRPRPGRPRHRLLDPAPRHVHQRVQLRQPDQPVRRRHGHRDGPGLRPAARRDRPLGRLHRRRAAAAVRRVAADQPRLAAGCPRSSSACSTGTVIGFFIGLLVARLGIPSFVVTLAAVPRAPGRHAEDHRRGRHDRHPQRLHRSSSTTATCRSGSAGSLAVVGRGGVRRRDASLTTGAAGATGPGRASRSCCGRSSRGGLAVARLRGRRRTCPSERSPNPR